MTACISATSDDYLRMLHMLHLSFRQAHLSSSPCHFSYRSPNILCIDTYRHDMCTYEFTSHGGPGVVGGSDSDDSTAAGDVVVIGN